MIIPEALQFLMENIDGKCNYDLDRKNFYQTILSSSEFQEFGNDAPTVWCRFVANGTHTFRVFSFRSIHQRQEWLDLLIPLGIEVLLYNHVDALWYHLEYGTFLRHISAPPSEIGCFSRIFDLESELFNIKKDLGIEDESKIITKCCGTYDYWCPTVSTDGLCEFFKRQGIVIDIDSSPPWIHQIMPVTNKVNNENCNAWKAKSK